MEVGQVFKIDAQTAKDLDNMDLEGIEYSIVKSRGSITDVDVRASKWEDGKPKRGRPRRFPRAVVARLLGEMNDPSLQAPVEDSTKELEEKAESLIDEEPVTVPDDEW